MSDNKSVDQDAEYYKKLCEMVSGINKIQHETIKLYHDRFMEDQKTIKRLQKKIEEMEEVK